MNKKKVFWRTILIVCLVGCVLCLGFVAWRLYRDYETEKQYEQLRQQAAAETEETETEAQTAASEEEGKEGEEAELPDGIFVDMEIPSISRRSRRSIRKSTRGSGYRIRISIIPSPREREMTAII